MALRNAGVVRVGVRSMRGMNGSVWQKSSSGGSMKRKEKKPRPAVILQMILTRKGGAHRDRKREPRRGRAAVEADPD